MIRRLTRTVRVDDGAMRTYVARPDASNAPAVVLLPGDAGLDDAAREACDAIAALGYLVVCPDLHWRGAARDAAFDPDAAVGDVVALLEAIRRETLGHERLAVIGAGPRGFADALRGARPDLGAAVVLEVEIPFLAVEPATPESARPSSSIQAWLASHLGPES